MKKILTTTAITALLSSGVYGDWQANGVDGIGWSELVNGNIISAVYTVYNTAFIGYFIAMLFFTFQAMLFIRAKNIKLNFITSLFFLSLYAVSSFVETASVHIMFFMSVMLLTGILFGWLLK